MGGRSPAKSSMERLDFSNDTAALAPKGPLTVARGVAGATGNADYGWWFGAQSGNTSWTGSEVYRLIFLMIVLRVHPEVIYHRVSLNQLMLLLEMIYHI